MANSHSKLLATASRVGWTFSCRDFLGMVMTNWVQFAQLRLITAILKVVYVRVFTNMVTTNWIMEAVFDAADDTLKVKKESGPGQFQVLRSRSKHGANDRYFTYAFNVKNWVEEYGKSKECGKSMKAILSQFPRWKSQSGWRSFNSHHHSYPREMFRCLEVGNVGQWWLCTWPMVAGSLTKNHRFNHRQWDDDEMQFQESSSHK